jgi:hypothetical protein
MKYPKINKKELDLINKKELDLINKKELDLINKKRFDNLFSVVMESINFDVNENNITALSKKDIELLAWNITTYIITQPF